MRSHLSQPPKNHTDEEEKSGNSLTPPTVYLSVAYIAPSLMLDGHPACS